jgi:hypothetical protein
VTKMKIQTPLIVVALLLAVIIASGCVNQPAEPTSPGADIAAPSAEAPQEQYDITGQMTQDIAGIENIQADLDAPEVDSAIGDIAQIDW